MADLKFFYGCMGSAKTLRLLTTAYNFEEKGIAFLVYKPKLDTRDGLNIIRSRAGLERDCVSVDGNFNFLNEVTDITKEYPAKFILIDEAQFLTAEQVDQLSLIVDNLNINVFCYGLRTDFKTNLFEGSRRLFELANDLEEIPSMCECGKRTLVNARFDEFGNIIFDGEQVKIGGNESYKSICRKCYNNKMAQDLHSALKVVK
jgi:thymidine kinase